MEIKRIIEKGNKKVQITAGRRQVQRSLDGSDTGMYDTLESVSVEFFLDGRMRARSSEVRRYAELDNCVGFDIVRFASDREFGEEVMEAYEAVMAEFNKVEEVETEVEEEMTEEEITWRSNYNNIVNEGGEGFVPRMPKKLRKKESQKQIRNGG